MGRLIPLLLLALAACTPSIPNVPSAPPLSSSLSNRAAKPFGGAAEPDIKVNAEWLRVGAEDGPELKFLMNGKPVSLEVLEKGLNDYAAKVNKDAGMPGLDTDGLSANPVVFSAGPKVSSRAFCATIEMLVSAKCWRYVVELEVPGHAPRRIWQQLPVDRGLDAPDTDEDRFPDVAEHAAAADRRRLNIFVVTADSVVYESNVDGEDRQTHGATKFSMDELLKDGWNETLYGSVRRALADVILTRQGTGAGSAWVEIAPLKSVLDKAAGWAPWAALFLAMDAVQLANTSPDRGRRGKLFTTLRFTDALDKYK